MTTDPYTLVFGASGDMGGAIARRLARQGHNLILHGLTGRRRLDELAAELNLPSDRCHMADMRDEGAVRQLITEVSSSALLRAIVYAVGQNPTAKTVSETDTTDWSDTIAINLTGAFLVLKHALPSLRKHGKARVVLISSIFGIESPARRAAYSASKHGLTALVQSIAKEEGERVQINAVAPGAMWSENVRRIFAKHARESGVELEDYVKHRVGSIPAGRFVHPEECASLVAYLLSDDAAFVSGEVIRISGGER